MVAAEAVGLKPTLLDISARRLNWQALCAANDEPEKTGKLDVRASNPLAV